MGKLRLSKVKLAQEGHKTPIRVGPGSACCLPYLASVCGGRLASNGTWGPGPCVEAHLPVAPASLCCTLPDAATTQWRPAGSSMLVWHPLPPFPMGLEDRLATGAWEHLGEPQEKGDQGERLSSVFLPHRDLDSFRERLPCSGVYSRGTWQKAGVYPSQWP